MFTLKLCDVSLCLSNPSKYYEITGFLNVGPCWWLSIHPYYLLKLQNFRVYKHWSPAEIFQFWQLWCRKLLQLQGYQTLSYCSWGICIMRFLWASGNNTLIYRSTHNLVLCVFIFKDTLFNTYCEVINISYMTHSTVLHAWMKPNHLSLSSGTFITLRSTSEYFGRTFGDHFK